MFLQQEIPFDDWFDKENCYYYNCNDNYIFIDNIEYTEGVAFDKESFYCPSFYYAFFVIDGSLKLIVDGSVFNVGKNQFFLVMPCNKIQVIKSNAKFFIIVPRAHIVLNIYDNISIPGAFKRIAFTIVHFQLDEAQLNNILNIYLLLKREAQRPNYLHKELVVREMISIFVYQTMANVTPDKEIQHIPNSKQKTLFLNFLDLLYNEYLYQRSVEFYADKLGITAKYLSYVTKQFTNKSASIVIDNFVVFKIKVLLYEGDMSVKNISELFNFKSQSFFGRYFKRITGMSPKAFVSKYNRRLLQIEEGLL